MIDETMVPDDSDYIYSQFCDGTLVIELREGTTLIAQRTVLRTVTSAETYVYTLTAGERAAITNWSDLSLWFTVNGTDTAKVKLQTLSTPDAGPVSMYIRLYMQE